MATRATTVQGTPTSAHTRHEADSGPVHSHPEVHVHEVGHGGHHHRRGLAVLLPTPSRHRHHDMAMPHIVFAGNPNVGKSTLFNALLGANTDVRNAPGTTVLIESGTLHRPGVSWSLVDTPGMASLDAISPDERVASKAAMGRDGYCRPDLIVVVVSALSLSRSLYLLSQLIDTGARIVVAVTMLDLARRQGMSVTAESIASLLPGIPCIPVDGRTGAGTQSLLDAVRTALANPQTAGNRHDGDQHHHHGDQHDAAGPAPSTVTMPPPGQHASTREVSDWVHATAERRFDWIAGIVSALNASDPERDRPTFSDRLDRVLLHPVAGILIFLGVMYGVFQATTTLAGPLIDWFDVTLRAWLTALIDWSFTMAAGSASLDGWAHDLMVNGILDGLITVLTFIPPMGIMFVILAVLEDSGYLTRAAFVMDRGMRAIGLDGRAFLPLVVGFGCNLPALAATRTLPDSRQRVMTGLLIPFTSCSARLSVYIVLAYAFFGSHAGLAIFLMYVASIVIILLVGLVLHRTQFRFQGTRPFTMNLPPYQVPELAQLCRTVALRLWAFITGASSIIITMIVIIWFLAAIPINAGATGDNAFARVDQAEDSAYGAAAAAVAPVFAPAGFDDWHATAALITGFVAKEVVVGSMSQSYQIGDTADESEAQQGQGSLGQAVRVSFERSSNGHGAAAAAAFMIFVLAYTPCLATVAEMRRQFGGRIAAQSVAMGLLVAYVLAVLVFQIGSLL